MMQPIKNALAWFLPPNEHPAFLAPAKPPAPVIDPLWVMSMLHDLGSPLKMADKLSRMLLSTKTGPEQRAYAERALPVFLQQTSTRLDGLWDVLKASSGAGMIADTPIVDLGEQAHIGVALVRPALTAYLSASTQLQMPLISVGVLEPAVPVRIFDNLIHRMIENLVFNSLEAGAKHIRITVTTIMGEAALIVHDNGPGFPDPLLEQITPGYTTKSDGHGIGLASVAANARRCGGSIRLENMTGAMVMVTFPLAEGPVE